jgi:Bacterial Ig-like domain
MIFAPTRFTEFIKWGAYMNLTKAIEIGFIAYNRNNGRKHLLILLGLAIAAISFFVAGCGSDDPVEPEDTTSPTVVSITPMAGAMSVSVNSAITVMFSEDVTVASVNSATFYIVGVSGPVTGTFVVNGKTATCTPTAPLAVSTAYTVTLTNGITDKAGNELVAPYVSLFTTGTGGGVTGLPAAYTSGTLSFTYTGLAESGTFSATGAKLALDGTIPIGATQFCGGTYLPGAVTSYAFCYGGKVRPDTKTDVALVVVSKAATSLIPGSYNVSVTPPVTIYAYLEGVSSFALPANFDPLNLVSWTQTVTADRKFVGLGGAVTIATIGATGYTGTFSGTMATADAIPSIMAVSGGTFNLAP